MFISYSYLFYPFNFIACIYWILTVYCVLLCSLLCVVFFVFSFAFYYLDNKWILKWTEDSMEVLGSEMSSL